MKIVIYITSILLSSQFVYSKDLICRKVNLENKTYIYCPETSSLYLLQATGKSLEQLKKRIAKIKENNTLSQGEPPSDSASSTAHTK